MPTAEASAEGLAYKKSGDAFELASIAQHRKANSKEWITWNANCAPRALLVHINGTPVTAEGIREEVKKWKKAQAQCERPEEGGRSNHFGFDGVKASREAFLKRLPDELCIWLLESKSTLNAIDNNVLGSQLALLWRLRDRYDVDSPKMPKLGLLAQHAPTAEWMNNFKTETTKHLFKFFKTIIPDADDATVLHVMRAWQETGLRDTITYLRPKTKQHGIEPNRVSKIDGACGAGKTYIGWAILRDADWAFIKIFVVHRTGMAKQIEEEAKAVNVQSIIDLTCNHHGSITPVADATAGEEGADQAGEDGHAEDGATNKQCVHILQKLKHHAALATKDNPVYIVITHYALRHLTSTKVRMPGPATKNGRLPARPEARTSLWAGFVQSIPTYDEKNSRGTVLAANRNKQIVVVVDEWHLVCKWKDLFDGLFADPDRCRTVLMSGTEYAVDVYANAIDKTNTDILMKAAYTGRMPMDEAIRREFLVPGHAEQVFVIEDETQELCDSAQTPIDMKIRQAAAWMVANALSTAAVYCSSIPDANYVAATLGPVLEEIANGKGEQEDNNDPCTAWVASIHSNHPDWQNEKTKEAAKKKWEPGDADIRVVASIAMLEEGYNHPELEACIMFAIPDNAGKLMQKIQRCMRARPGKAIGRILLFGDDKVGAHVARLLNTYDTNRDAKQRSISLGVAPSTLAGHAAVWTDTREGGARDQCANAVKTFEDAVGKSLVGYATHEEAIVAKLDGFWDFVASHPAYDGVPSTKVYDYCKPGDKQKFEYTLNGGTVCMFAYSFYKHLREGFHDAGHASYLHTEDLRCWARALPFWGADPEVESTKKTPLQRWQEYKDWFKDDPNRKPPSQSSKDPKEASLAKWTSKAFPTHDGDSRTKRWLMEALGGPEEYAAALAFHVEHKARKSAAENAQLVRNYYARTRGRLPSKQSKDPKEAALGTFLSDVTTPKKRTRMINGFGGEKCDGEEKHKEFVDWLAEKKGECGGPSAVAATSSTDVSHSDGEEEEESGETMEVESEEESGEEESEEEESGEESYLARFEAQQDAILCGLKREREEDECSESELE